MNLIYSRKLTMKFDSGFIVSLGGFYFDVKRS